MAFAGCALSAQTFPGLPLPSLLCGRLFLVWSAGLHVPPSSPSFWSLCSGAQGSPPTYLLPAFHSHPLLSAGPCVSLNTAGIRGRRGLGLGLRQWDPLLCPEASTSLHPPPTLHGYCGEAAWALCSGPWAVTPVWPLWGPYTRRPQPKDRAEVEGVTADSHGTWSWGARASGPSGSQGLVLMNGQCQHWTRQGPVLLGHPVSWAKGWALMGVEARLWTGSAAPVAQGPSNLCGAWLALVERPGQSWAEGRAR